MSDAERVWFRLMRLDARIRLAMTARLKRVGLSIAQCDVLTTLTEREGMSQQDLAQRLYVTKGNISGLIDRLEAAGLVERRSIASDRRSHAIYLTPDGHSAARAGIQAQSIFVADSLGQLGETDLVDFERVILRLRDTVRSLQEEARSGASQTAP